MGSFKLFVSFALFLVFVSENAVLGAKLRKESSVERLLLTPYIKSGKIEEARMASLVKWGRDSLEGIPSYTGFLTVNETANSNLFFWFVPAMVEDPEDAPLMVWLNGGPGTSSMFGFFVENGPFKVKKRGRIPKLVLRVRKDTWARKHNILYIDSPVGTGFSFTDNPDDYSTTQDHAVNHLYTALRQFYLLFPEFAKQDLYLAGESHAAKTITHFGLHIHQTNQKEKNATQINLKGIIAGGPIIDPPTLIKSYSDYFYHLGLIDDQALAHMKSQEAEIATLLSEEKYSQAQDLKQNLIFSPTSYLSNITGYDYLASALETRIHKKRDYYTRYLNQSSTRKLIHVGDQPFNNVSSLVRNHFSRDMELSYKSELEQLLSLKYRVLIYVGQMDMITPHTGVSALLQSLQFEGQKEFEKSERRVVRDLKRGDVSGYVKAHANLFYVLIRNAGHHAPSDQPRWCREMVERFISGRSDEDF